MSNDIDYEDPLSLKASFDGVLTKSSQIERERGSIQALINRANQISTGQINITMPDGTRWDLAVGRLSNCVQDTEEIGPMETIVAGVKEIIGMRIARHHRELLKLAKEIADG